MIRPKVIQAGTSEDVPGKIYGVRILAGGVGAEVKPDSGEAHPAATELYGARFIPAPRERPWQTVRLTAGVAAQLAVELFFEEEDPERPPPLAFAPLVPGATLIRSWVPGVAAFENGQHYCNADGTVTTVPKSPISVAGYDAVTLWCKWFGHTGVGATAMVSSLALLQLADGTFDALDATPFPAFASATPYVVHALRSARQAVITSVTPLVVSSPSSQLVSGIVGTHTYPIYIMAGGAGGWTGGKPPEFYLYGWRG